MGLIYIYFQFEVNWRNEMLSKLLLIYVIALVVSFRLSGLGGFVFMLVLGGLVCVLAAIAIGMLKELDLATTASLAQAVSGKRKN